MNLLGCQRLTKNGDYQSRIAAALVVAALDVLQEPLPSGVMRQSVALQTVLNPDNSPVLRQALWLVAIDPVIVPSIQPDGTTTATDEALYAAVKRAWDIAYPAP